MQATLREFEDWLEDSVPDAVMIGYEKALAKLEECLPFEDTLVSHEGWHTRAGQSLQLVSATSRRDKFQHVNWPFLVQNLVAGTNQLAPQIQTSFNFWDKSLRLIP